MSTEVLQMTAGAYVDLVSSHSVVNTTQTWFLEGWATWPDQPPRLFIRTDSNPRIVSAYLYRRSDLSGIPGAIGFGIVLARAQTSEPPPCVLIRRGLHYEWIGGSSC